MKVFLRLTGFIKPFARVFVVAMLLNIAFAAVTTASIAIINLVMEVLQDMDKVAQGPDGNNAEQPAAFGAALEKPSFLEEWKDAFYANLRGLIEAEDPLVTLLHLSLLIVSIFLLKNILKYLSAIVTVRLEEGLIKSIRDNLFSKMTGLSMDYFTGSKTGTLISLVTNDVSQVNRSITPVIMSLMREPVEIILYLMLLLSFSPFLTLIAFSTSIISLVLIQVATRYLRRYAARMQDAMADFTSVLQETISGIRIVKAFGMEAESIRRFVDQTRHYVLSAFKHRKVISLVPAVNEMFAMAAMCAVLYMGGKEVFAGEMPMRDLLTFLFALFAIMSPIAKVVQIPPTIQRGLVAAERVFTVLDRKTSITNGSTIIGPLEHAIEVRDVSFAYNENPVLQKVSFTLQKSRKIALVGASGSGKSTMIDLIVRFYDPTAGAILKDGIDIRAAEADSYRRLFGVVSQEAILFNDSVANNIRYGRPDASRAEIEQAAKIANAHDFITSLDNGYDTIIGDRGVLLSGGQKQRLAIARALVRNPDVLIFDEATSALDSESEQIVQEAINRVLENSTAIIIAHRLSTIVTCDEILVFKDGFIVERGTHEELLALNGVYRKLCDIQFVSGQ